MKDKSLEIAIIGISGRFPGADSITEYWENLNEGNINIGKVPENRWEHSKLSTAIAKEPFKIYCNTGGFMKDNKKYDYKYFNMSKEEAVVLDPQQKIVLN